MGHEGMVRGRFTASIVFLLGGSFAAAYGPLRAAPLSPQLPSSAAAAAAPHRAVLQKYCITCHNERLRTAGLALDTVDISKPDANPDVWERVITRLRARSMPPAGNPRPDAA